MEDGDGGRGAGGVHPERLKPPFIVERGCRTCDRRAAGAGADAPVGGPEDVGGLAGELAGDDPLVLDADVEGAEGPAGGVEGGVERLGEEGGDGGEAVLAHVGAGEADEGAGLREDGGAVHDEGAAAERDVRGEEEVEVEEAARHAVHHVELAVQLRIERGRGARRAGEPLHVPAEKGMGNHSREEVERGLMLSPEKGLVPTSRGCSVFHETLHDYYLGVSALLIDPRDKFELLGLRIKPGKDKDRLFALVPGIALNLLGNS